MSLIFIIILFVCLFYTNRMLVDLEGNKAIETYIYIYETVKDEKFNKAYFDNEDKLILEDENSKKNITLKEVDKRYFYEIIKETNGDIILRNSGGIFREDYDIIFSKKLYFNEQKYIEIKKIYSNLYLCKKIM